MGGDNRGHAPRVWRPAGRVAAFMAGLYAVRGGAVASFVSGGGSFAGYVLLMIAFALASPFVIGFALFLGIADTWLDLRARVASPAT